MKFNNIIIFLICLVAGIVPAAGQYGFNKTFSFEGSAGLDFDDILWDDDGIVIRGNIYIDSVDLWGLFVCRLDTLGQIAWSRTIMDVLGTTDVVSNTPTRFIKTSDGGYLLPVNNFGRGTIGLYKLDHVGNIEFAVEFENEEQVIIPNYLIEFSDNYYISGYRQRLDLGLDVFLLKTDLNGHQIWMKHFGSDTLDEGAAGMVLKLDSTITIGCQIRPPNFQDLPFEYQWRRPWLLTLDTSGAVVKEWKGEQNDSRTKSGFGLINTPNGDLGMIYSEYKKIFTGFQYEIYGAPSVSIMDYKFNLKWKNTFGNFTSSANTYFDIKYDANRDEWIAVGQLADHSRLVGCIVKYSNQGDIIWSILDTAIYNPTVLADHYIGGLTVSPSGSIYAAGKIDYSAPPFYEFGWILKVTPDGCVDTLCTTTSILDQISPKDEVRLYPNPAVDYITLEARHDLLQHSILECYNAIGSLLLKQELHTDNELVAIGGFPPGPIFYKILSKDVIIKSGEFIKL